jgi:hypothetical protein
MATLAQIAVGAASTGGLATVIVSTLRGNHNGNTKRDMDKKEDSQ